VSNERFDATDLPTTGPISPTKLEP